MGEPRLTQNIAEQIRMEMARRQWRQVTLAKAARISESTLGRKLRGDKEPFDLDELERICAAFDLPPEELFALARSRCSALFSLGDGTKQALDEVLAA